MRVLSSIIYAGSTHSQAQSRCLRYCARLGGWSRKVKTKFNWPYDLFRTLCGLCVENLFQAFITLKTHIVDTSLHRFKNAKRLRPRIQPKLIKFYVCVLIHFKNIEFLRRILFSFYTAEALSISQQNLLICS